MTDVHEYERARLNGQQPGGQVDVITLGEPLICLTAEDGRLTATRHLVKSIGGAEGNLAVGLARLGLRTAMIAKVGRDPLGDEVLRTLRGEGVDVGWVSRSPDLPTGLMIKERRAADDVHVYYYRRGSAAADIDETDIPAQNIGSAKLVHLTGITLALGAGPRRAVHAALTASRAGGVPVSFDPNFRLKLWSSDEAVSACREVIAHVDHLLLGEDEALACAGTHDLRVALDRLAAAGPSSVVIKRGAAGVLARRGDQTIALPAEPVAQVVDTVGAGDAFNAGYLFAVLRGPDFRSALEVGTWVASRVVSHRGDYEGLPDVDEYHSYARRHRPVLR